MTAKLTGTAALVTGASSGIGAATARLLAEHSASVALVARRRDRLEALAAEIDKAGGTALVVEADITDRIQAEAAVQQAVERFGRLDTLVNPFYEQTEVLAPEDIADGVAYMVTRPRHTAIGELWIMPTAQV
jgi:NADP-dependent 3-hydroxy acid dehydrogenase YdfG